jgi:hypothetical protein
MRTRSPQSSGHLLIVALPGLAMPILPTKSPAANKPSAPANPNPENSPFLRRWKGDHLEDLFCRREDSRINEYVVRHTPRKEETP